MNKLKWHRFAAAPAEPAEPMHPADQQHQPHRQLQPRRQPQPRLRLTWTTALAAVCLLAGIALTINSAAAADTPDTGKADDQHPVQLAQQRWEEIAYGLSLRPPANAELTQYTPDGALAHFTVKDAYTIRVFIHPHVRSERQWLSGKGTPEANWRSSRDIWKRTGGPMQYGFNPQKEKDTADEGADDADAPEPVSLGDLKNATIREIAFSNPEASLLEDELITVSDRPAARMMYKIRSKHFGEWYLGQVLLKIDPYTIARIELHADANAIDQARPAFDAVVNSVKFKSPLRLRSSGKNGSPTVNAGSKSLRRAASTRACRASTGSASCWTARMSVMCASSKSRRTCSAAMACA